MIPAGTLVVNYAAITSFRMIFEEREKRKIRKTFSQYLSPGVIALIEKDPQKYIRPGGETKELTVMFSDIRGFTTISEGLTPDELVSPAERISRRNDRQSFSPTSARSTNISATPSWHSGDRLIRRADHAYRACSCALRDDPAALTKLNAKWKAEGRKQIAIGIGLNTGPVNVGNMGSAKRLAWTVMGDNVNLASRLEGITKQYHVQHRDQRGDIPPGRGPIRLPRTGQDPREGQKPAGEHLRVAGRCGGRLEIRDAAGPFDHAMEAYRAQNWQEAAGQVRRDAHALSRTTAPRKFSSSAHWSSSDNAPEADWDGVYVMKTK